MDTQAKHTKGPWQVAGVRHSGDLKIGPQTRLHFVGPDGDGVAAVFYDMQTGKGYADARLIAAAPDMLAALHTVYSRLPDALAADLGYVEAMLADLGKPYIAKATGG